MSIKIRLKSRKEVAAGTMAFHFEKLEGFTFIAGQAGDFTLGHPPKTDKEGNTRSFTLASAPYEDELVIVTRMRDSAFKLSLKTIALGTELSFDGPWGELTLDDDARIPAVFLTGGIGITPFRSIVLQAAHDRLAHPIFLFYSNRRPKDAAFLEEMTVAQRANPKFTFVPTMTEMEKSAAKWSGETGYIDKAMLLKSIKDLSVPIYYLTGPPKLVSAMQTMLSEAGVKGDRIRAEEFSGY